MGRPIGIALLGMGVVGTGFVEVMITNKENLIKQVGSELILRHVLVKDRSKTRTFDLPSHLFCESIDEILTDDSVDLVIELMGGEHPAFNYITRSLEHHKNVVTANKEVMAKHNSYIISLANQNNVRILYEASVAGGTPIIAPLLRDFTANKITSIKAIINGTTNYILSRMASENSDYLEILADAQKLGYAEADPTNDVEGIDAAYKLAILSSLSYRTEVRDIDVYREGITNISPKDFKYAEELGFAIKLMALSELNNNIISARVHPVLIPKTEMLANVNGVLNAVQVETDLIGNVLFHGAGAGAYPTASAVLADTIDICRDINREVILPNHIVSSEKYEMKPITSITCKYYLRIDAKDQPGVLAQIAKILAENLISIASFIQKDSEKGSAELIIMTHEALELSVQCALKKIEELPVVNSVQNSIRVI
jgi:homoserine dehydrogenase